MGAGGRGSDKKIKRGKQRSWELAVVPGEELLKHETKAQTLLYEKQCSSNLLHPDIDLPRSKTVGGDLSAGSRRGRGRRREARAAGTKAADSRRQSLPGREHSPRPYSSEVPHWLLGIKFTFSCGRTPHLPPRTAHLRVLLPQTPLGTPRTTPAFRPPQQRAAPTGEGKQRRRARGRRGERLHAATPESPACPSAVSPLLFPPAL
ncbi:uncharacterized protein LOC116810767 [Hylobates moloch]|uniref:uncharacterized protein LOC116810767 n=1 Tax=Hylobates moloch TaxID=81572 RepID=UPI0013F2A584|nr:uncharacterized protein LOC116810767 [Hylobates moloch]